MCEVVVGDGEEHTVVAFGAARCGHLKGHRGPVKLVHDALCRYYSIVRGCICLDLFLLIF